MTQRSYRQICGVAKALDLIGERWTLLIVRELLLGPKRFGVLRDAMPGISANLLSARLRALTDAEVVERIQLPAPAAVEAYALTARGEELRPVIESLALWGFELLEPEAEYEQGWEARPSWLTSTLAAGAEPAALADLDGRTYNFAVDGDRFSVRVREGVAQVRHGELPEPDVEFTTDLRAYADLATGEAETDDPLLAPLFVALAGGVPARSG
ncbi:MAG: helix-turn-helix domain-containing protein [Solirubrobacterales bacterium]